MNLEKEPIGQFNSDLGKIDNLLAQLKRDFTPAVYQYGVLLSEFYQHIDNGNEYEELLLMSIQEEVIRSITLGTLVRIRKAINNNNSCEITPVHAFYSGNEITEAIQNSPDFAARIYPYVNAGIIQGNLILLGSLEPEDSKLQLLSFKEADFHPELEFEEGKGFMRRFPTSLDNVKVRYTYKLNDGMVPNPNCSPDISFSINK